MKVTIKNPFRNLIPIFNIEYMDITSSFYTFSCITRCFREHIMWTRVQAACSNLALQLPFWPAPCDQTVFRLKHVSGRCNQLDWRSHPNHSRNQLLQWATNNTLSFTNMMGLSAPKVFWIGYNRDWCFLDFLIPSIDRTQNKS